MSKAMKFRILNRIRRCVIVAVVGACAMCISAFAGDVRVPEPSNPPRLVNDYASLLSAEQCAVLEDSLVNFARETSNQIVVVTMPDLGDYEPWQMAQEIGQKWGVGTKKHSNGVVILVKPKNKTKGEAFIATGYGLEGALTDALCWKIVNNEMIPCFRKNDYYGGIDAALEVIKPVVRGEYNEEQYDESNKLTFGEAMFLLLFAIGLVFLVIAVLKSASKNSNNGRGNSGTFGGGGPIFFGPIGGRRSSGFGDSGFGGGFGGFGGGGFGGGGAGGSW